VNNSLFSLVLSKKVAVLLETKKLRTKAGRGTEGGLFSKQKHLRRHAFPEEGETIKTRKDCFRRSERGRQKCHKAREGRGEVLGVIPRQPNPTVLLPEDLGSSRWGNLYP